ncbi:MAG: hypothetical protein ABSA92_14095 [Candidatus Bathyarchaeia archaeon]
MGNRKNRSRAQILLTRMELDRLYSAVTESGVNKSFLVMEAIQHGLPDLDPKNIQTGRTFRIDAWVPTEFKQRIKQLAETHAVTQQSLLRHLLFKHLKAAPWKQTKPGPNWEVTGNQT